MSTTKMPSICDTTIGMSRMWSEKQPSNDEIMYCPTCDTYEVRDSLDSYNPEFCMRCRGKNSMIFQGAKTNHLHSTHHMDINKRPTIVDHCRQNNKSPNDITYCPKCNQYHVYELYSERNPEVCEVCKGPNTRTFSRSTFS